MRFRNTFLVLLENFKNTYKILLYKLIVAIVCTALYFVLIFPEINAIFSSAEWLALKENFTQFIASFLPTSSSEQFETLREQLIDGTLPAFFQISALTHFATSVEYACLSALFKASLSLFASAVFSADNVCSDK